MSFFYLATNLLVNFLRSIIWHYDSEGRVSYIRDLAWGILTHNVVTFFGAKFPQPVENSRASSLATILVTVVVVTVV